MTNVLQNVDELEKIMAILSRMSPKARVIITVSPVPMSETFQGKDAVVANMYSKSTLRAAAEICAGQHSNVDYFPSFDMVSMSPRSKAYGVDCLHVADSVVGMIMQEFLRLYVGSEVVAEDFTELGYLAANPDVEDAVRLAVFSSGFEHWQKYGKLEGRLLSPRAGPTDLMIAAGVTNPQTSKNE